MLKRISYLVLALLLGVPIVALVTTAQDTTEQACEASQYEQFSSAFGELVDTLADPVIDNDSGLLYLLQLDTAIQTQRAVCGGGVFNKGTHPDGIIGPILFSGTLYQGTITSESRITVGNVVIEGDCPVAIYQYTGSDRTEDTELWRMGGDCVMMLEIDTGTDSDEWTLTLERLQ